LNKHSILQELYWPEKKAGKINREKKVVILPPLQKINYVMKESNLATLMSNPIISSTKDEEEKAHPNVDINTLEEKMDQLSDRIISLEKLIQRLTSSQQQEQTNEPQSSSYYVGRPLQSLFGGKASI
jgi:TolA-binding protein